MKGKINRIERLEQVIRQRDACYECAVGVVILGPDEMNRYTETGVIDACPKCHRARSGKIYSRELWDMV